MGKLIRAEFYQLKKSKLFWVLFIVIAVMCLIALSNVATDTVLYPDGFTGSLYITEGLGMNLSISAMFILIGVGIVFAEDYNDKTINYEIMGGNKRSDVFFSKVIVTLIAITVGALIIIVLPFIIFTAIYGFGNDAKVNEILFKLLIAVFVIIRVVIEMIFINVLLKNKFVAMVLGFAVTEIAAVIMSMDVGGSMAATYFNGLLNLYSIGMYNTDMRWQLSSMREIVTYQDPFFGIEGVKVILFAIVFSVVYLYLAYSFFKRDDFK